MGTLRAFGGAIIVSILGLKLIYNGWRRRRPQRLRELGIPCWVMVAGGILCQIPMAIVVYAAYLRCAVPGSCW
jgi:hypothetical protein